MLHESPFDTAITAHSILESGVLSQFADGGVLEGLRRVNGLVERDARSAGRGDRLVERAGQLALQPGCVAVDARAVIERVSRLEGLLEEQGPGRNGIGRLADARPEDPVPDQRLVQQRRQQVVGEVRVRPLQRGEVPGRQQVEDEEVVALAEQLRRDACPAAG